MSRLSARLPEDSAYTRPQISRKSLNIKYSNVPLNVPVLYPSFVKERDETRKILGSVRELEENNTTCHPSSVRYPMVKRHDDQATVKMIRKANPISNSWKKSKGLMYVSELWSDRKLKNVIKGCDIEKVNQARREAESEGLREKIVKLERIFERRPRIDARDTKKVFQEFMKKGINSPSLRNHTGSVSMLDGGNGEKLKLCLVDIERIQTDSVGGRCSVEPVSGIEGGLLKKTSICETVKSFIYVKEQEDNENDTTASTQPLPSERFLRKGPYRRNLVSLRGLIEQGERRLRTNLRKDSQRGSVADRRVDHSQKLPPILKVTELVSMITDQMESSCISSYSKRRSVGLSDSTTQESCSAKSKVEASSFRVACLKVKANSSKDLKREKE